MNTFKILVSDPMSDSGLAPLREASNMEVDLRTDLSPAQLVDVIPAYHALLVRSGTQVTAEVIQAGANLRVIGRAGVGVDNIDVDAATRAGIIVVNAPTGNTVAAAEHTVAMLMALARNIPQADAHVRSGGWKRSQYTGIEIRDKVLGTVGLGRVAQEVVRRARGLGMTVLAYDPYISSEFAAQHGATLTSLDEMLPQVDFLTLHVPLTEQTRNTIGAPQLARMKPNARILNVARGGVLDEQALADAVQSGQIAGAALDVFEQEPLGADSPLRSCPQIILTPHLGASTIEAQEKVAEDVALQVLEVLSDLPARYAVNAPMIPPKDLEFLIPYIDLAERLGRFIQQLGAQGVRELEITAYGRLAGFDLSYINAAVIKGLLADAVQMRINLVNAGLVAEQRGMTLIERKKHEHDLRYDTMLTIRAKTGSQAYTVRGAMLQDEPHIVAIDDLWVDFPASGHLVISLHQDRPGIIGGVGTILGQSDVNISFMHVGRHAPRTTAVMVLGTDEVVPDSLMQTLNAQDHITWLRSVSLG
ncbi:MAG: phosphoglycerate dehydrogenase [Caldilineaceae bacterium]|nr:phosphoglycerate dehydrogenase [Caldilineaceae bacterium]